VGYDWIAFGAPWHTSYTYQYYFDWSRSPLTTYVTPPLIGLCWLLFGPSGLFVITPALVLALWGLLLLARRTPARALLLLGVMLMVLLPTALHRTYYGWGSRDTRYLLAIVPALYAPLALWLDAVALPRRPLARGAPRRGGGPRALGAADDVRPSGGGALARGGMAHRGGAVARSGGAYPRAAAAAVFRHACHAPGRRALMPLAVVALARGTSGRIFLKAF
jgi:hypothetical protein